MKILPPGNILQNLYLKERIRKNKWKTFLEIGSGNGYLSNVLLKNGLSGIGCDLNDGACLNNEIFNEPYINKGLYSIFNQDFLTLNNDNKFDLVISSMVIEHFPEDALFDLINKCKSILNKNGRIVFFVPSSNKYWGIEDEIAGHIKRYEFEDFKDFKPKFNLSVEHIAGLTYPMSNFLFKLSNYLVRRKESKVLTMDQKEKTIYTGNRDVPYKTNFPMVFGFFLNEFVMFPIHVLQKWFVNNPNALVIYCELSINE